MKDFLGQELKIGDRVAYIRVHSRSKSRLIEGYVVGFSSTQIRIGATPEQQFGFCKIVEHVVKLS